MTTAETPAPSLNAGRPRRAQQERRAATQAQIADATITLLARNGYHGTTIAAVADLAGVSRGGMLHYYPQKIDLVAGVIEQVVDAALETLDERMKDLPTGRARIPAAVDFLYQAFYGERSQAFLAAQVAARSDPELRARIADVAARVSQRVERLAPALFGQKIAQRRDLPQLAAFIVATIRGVITLNPADHPEPDDQLWAFAKRTLVATIRGG